MHKPQSCRHPRAPCCDSTLCIRSPFRVRLRARETLRRSLTWISTQRAVQVLSLSELLPGTSCHEVTVILTTERLGELVKLNLVRWESWIAAAAVEHCAVCDSTTSTTNQRPHPLRWLSEPRAWSLIDERYVGKVGRVGQAELRPTPLASCAPNLKFFGDVRQFVAV